MRRDGARARTPQVARFEVPSEEEPRGALEASPVSAMKDARSLPATRTQVSRNTVRLASGAHVVQLTELSDTVVLLQVRGREAEAGREALVAELSRIFERPPVVKLFVDMREASSVPASGTEDWLRFARRYRARFERVVVLQSSRLVEMAMQVLGMAIGAGVFGMYASEAAFRAELERAAPGVGRLPPFP